jgi:uncharacterized protein YndB with AHSA1/START domain
VTTGTYTEIDGRPAVRLVREFAHPVDRVWATVTDPDELATWFPARVAVDGDLRTGATLRFTFEVDGDGGTGTVLDHRPPGRLAFTWGGDEVWFELEPLDTGGTRLVLTNVLEARDTAARNGAGWEVCLDALARTAEEGTAEAPDATPTPEWERHYDAYVAEGVPSGAPIPG